MRCRLNFHAHPPSADLWWNGREWIGLCPRCRRFVYRETLRGWQTVPRTMAIVWKPKTGTSATPPCQVAAAARDEPVPTFTATALSDGVAAMAPAPASTTGSPSHA